MNLLEKLLEQYERAQNLAQNLKVIEEEAKKAEATIEAQVYQLYVQILFARWLGQKLGTIINPQLIVVQPEMSNCNDLEQDRWTVHYLDRPTGGYLACESSVYLRRDDTTGNFSIEINTSYSEPRWSGHCNSYVSLTYNDFLQGLSWLRRTYQTTKENYEPSHPTDLRPD